VRSSDLSKCAAVDGGVFSRYPDNQESVCVSVCVCVASMSALMCTYLSIWEAFYAKEKMNIGLITS